MRTIVPLILAGFFGTMAVATFAMSAYWETYEKVPDQPIAFPHDIHAGDLNIACTHCHQYVEVGKQATVPALSICMDCHAGMQSDKPEIIKLQGYWERQEEVAWQRIHTMPDHVYFSHKRHIKAGVDCAECHGDMTVVNTVKQVRTFQMGFCVSCHRANAASQDCWTCHK